MEKVKPRLPERLNNLGKVLDLGAFAVGVAFNMPGVAILGAAGYIIDKRIGDPIAHRLSGRRSDFTKAA